MEPSPSLLVTWPDVELLEVGEDWPLSTGVRTFTTEDLASAVAAQDNPQIPTPIIKFGHTDPRFMGDGDPAYGRILNQRVTPDGMTLKGDFVGIPLWLARCLPVAYPRRSIEGGPRAMTRMGQVMHDGFYLSALALLGAYMPAIGTLEDLELMWIDGNPPMYDATTGEVVSFEAAMEDLGIVTTEMIAAAAAATRPPTSPRAQRQTSIAAATQVEDVRRQWYEEEADHYGYWAWIRSMYVDPPELIIDDDDGHLYRVGYTISGDTITFGEGEEVKIEYVAAGRIAAGARKAQEAIAMYATAEESRPDRVRPNDDEASQEGDVQIDASIYESLGLAATATDEEVNTALTARLAATAPVETPPVAPVAPVAPAAAAAPVPEVVPTAPVAAGTFVAPPGTHLVDAAAWAATQATMASISAENETRRNQARDSFFTAAVKDGKFAPAMVDTYRSQWETEVAASIAAGKAPEAPITKSVIDSLLPGAIPVHARGLDGGEGAGQVAAHAYPEWMRQGAQVAATADEDLPKHVTRNGGVTIISG